VRKLIVFGLLMILAVAVQAQSMSSWEIKWNFYGVRHEGLMILAGNVGTFRVKIMDRNSGELMDVVDQYVKVKVKSTGIVMNCYNPRSMNGYNTYSADNFFLDKDDSMYMMDDAGNWSTEVGITEISNMDALMRMKRKYGL